jgi:UDP-N-acetylglucosamine transferase subunit ALG13
MEVHPFDRLARAVDALAADGTVGEDFFVQLGACRYTPTHARVERFLSFDQVCAAIREASVVITHAGAGSTLVCIQQGKHPIMVPRRPSLGEHVDEHQLRFAEKLAGAGLATAVDDLTTLSRSIADVRGRSAPAGAVGSASALTTWLEGFWQELARAPGGRGAAR